MFMNSNSGSSANGYHGHSKLENRSYSLPRHLGLSGVIINKEHAQHYVKRPRLTGGSMNRMDRSSSDVTVARDSSVGQGFVEPATRNFQRPKSRSFRSMQRLFKGSKGEHERFSRSMSNRNRSNKVITPIPQDNTETFHSPSSSVDRYLSSQPLGHGPIASNDVSWNGKSNSVCSVEKAPKRLPAVTGIVNHGSTCYLNAVVQCLSSIDPLAEHFVKDKYLPELNPDRLKSKEFGTEGELTHEFARLLKCLWFSTYDKSVSKRFVDIVEYWSRDSAGFVSGRQHDAQEFLVWLLDKIHEDLNVGTKQKTKPLKDRLHQSEEHLANRQWKTYLECHSSSVQRLFQAQFRSSVTCPLCNNASRTFDPYTCVSISVPQKTSVALFVVMVYYHRRPRLLCLGLNADITATFGEVKECLAQEGKVAYERIILGELSEKGFKRTLRNSETVSCLGSRESSHLIHAIEAATVSSRVQGNSDEYVNIIVIHAFRMGSRVERYGSPTCFCVSRECSFSQLWLTILNECRGQFKYGITAQDIAQDSGHLRIAEDYHSDPYIRPGVPLPLYLESVDAALLAADEEYGPPHLKLILEWKESAKDRFFYPMEEEIFDHSSACDLRDEILEPASSETLQQCLESYTQPERVSMPEWRCPNPNCRRVPGDVFKQIMFKSLPDIVLVHLKRFSQLSTGEQVKLETMVQYPVHGLDLMPFTHTANTPSVQRRNRSQREPKNGAKLEVGEHIESGSTIYDLIAICSHHGASMNSGHYTACCLNSVSNSWFCFDDDKVYSVKESELVTRDAYILFYQRRSLANKPEYGSNPTHHWFYSTQHNPPLRPSQPFTSGRRVGLRNSLPISTDKLNGEIPNKREVGPTLPSTSSAVSQGFHVTEAQIRQQLAAMKPNHAAAAITMSNSVPPQTNQNSREKPGIEQAEPGLDEGMRRFLDKTQSQFAGRNSGRPRRSLSGTVVPPADYDKPKKFLVRSSNITYSNRIKTRSMQETDL